MTSRYVERVTHIEQLLLIQNLVIDTSSLRDACRYGVPDTLRPLCWRLFLGYLPRERQEWQVILKKCRSEYHDLVVNLIQTNVDTTCNSVDHPLSVEKESQWAKFFNDNEVLLQIDKDVRRLRPEIDFFQRTTHYPIIEGQRLSERLQTLNEDGDNVSPYHLKTLQPGNEFHWQVVERILFIYSKMNTGVKYVQGMNEIIGPIYYAFASDPDLEWARFAEADAFYCFQLLMSEIKDNFIKSLDKSSCGIEWTLSHFSCLFETVDPELFLHLLKLDVKPQFYAFRWLSLLLSQEFSLPDLINLWDTVFASENRIETTEFICLSMLIHVRTELLNADFSQVVRLLQNYPVVDTNLLVTQACELRKQQNSASDSSRSSTKFWNKERISALVSGAKERLSNYAASKRNQNKSDGSIKYNTEF